MQRSSYLITAAVVALGLFAVPGCDSKPAKDGSVRIDTVAAAPLSDDSAFKYLHPNMRSIEGSGLRFDGVYRYNIRNLNYLIRFYRQGFAVLITGSDSTPGQEHLRGLFQPRMASVPESGFHNVPVVVQDDSVFIITPTRRGNIDYRGAIIGPDSLSFFKYSHINGAKGTFGYHFEKDPSK